MAHSNGGWRRHFCFAAIVFFLGLTRPTGIVEGQGGKADPTNAKVTQPDFGSMDAVLGALYEVISGPAGKKRDWDRMRSLFLPEARLIAVGQNPTGEVSNRAMDVEDYISTAGPFLEREGFFEREIARHTEQFGHLASVFSTYEARRDTTDSKPLVRGINSIQLFNDGKRWWIVTILWQGESPNHPLPDKYVK